MNFIISNFFEEPTGTKGVLPVVCTRGGLTNKTSDIYFQKGPAKRAQCRIADHHHHINREAVTPHFSNDDESK
jgi:hypothetical protein